MKNVFSFFLILFASLQIALAQSEIVTATTTMIVAGRYDRANAYLDSVLKKNKRNVDALMMKGNVLLNQTLDTTQVYKDITENDESIFYATVGDKKAKIVLPETVTSIEKYWLKCIKLKPNRIDILKGLCTLYAMALQPDKLKTEIVALKNAEPNTDGEQVYNIAEYARKFKERGQFEQAIDLYCFIAQLFPNEAGIRCDIASEYFYAGNMRQTLVWLDSCYHFKTVDETSFLNGAFMYSELGYFDEAQNVFNTYSNIYNRKMGDFYYGLRLFADSNDKYISVLTTFYNTADSNTYYNESTLARKLLALTPNFSLPDYRKLIADEEIQDYYKVLIYHRAFLQFNDTCEPFLDYGTMQSTIKNYSAAVQFLEEGESCKLNPAETENWQLQYAYTLYMFDNKPRAMQFFTPLFTSRSPFIAQAAKYFTATILHQQNKPEAAQKLWQEIAAQKENIKYVELAKKRLQ